MEGTVLEFLNINSYQQEILMSFQRVGNKINWPHIALTCYYLEKLHVLSIGSLEDTQITSTIQLS